LASPSRPKPKPKPKAESARLTLSLPPSLLPPPTARTLRLIRVSPPMTPRRNQGPSFTRLSTPHHQAPFSLPLTTGEKHDNAHGGSVIPCDDDEDRRWPLERWPYSLSIALNLTRLPKGKIRQLEVQEDSPAVMATQRDGARRRYCAPAEPRPTWSIWDSLHILLAHQKMLG